MKITIEQFEALEFEVLENRSTAENNPLNLVKGYQADSVLIDLLNEIGPEHFKEFVEAILDENE